MILEGYEYAWLVILFIAIFFAIRLAVGIWAGRKVQDNTDYVVAGRRLPIHMAAASIMATWFAAETLMGASQTAYDYGFQGVIFDPFGAAACLFISGLFFVRLMRRAKYLTVVDFFERRYNKTMIVLSVIAQMLTYFSWTAAQIVAGGAIAQGIFGIDPTWGMIIIITIVAAYTTMGGMLADTLLDFFQMFFTAGGITLVFVVMLKAVGGFPGLIEGAGSTYVSEPFRLLPSVTEGYLGYTGLTGWMYWVAAWMAIGLGSVATQDLMQRSMAARNQATSVYGSYGAGIMYLFFGIMSPLIGIMVFKLSPGLEDTSYLLVSAAMTHLPAILTAIFIAALTSALMSTSDSSLLAGASAVTENLIPVITGKKLEGKKALWATRIMVVVNALVAVSIAMWARTIYELSILAWSLLLVGLFVPFAFGMYWKKANSWGAVAAFLGGFITWAVATLFFFKTGLGGQSTAVVCEFTADLGVYSDGWWCALWDAVYISSFVAFFVSMLLMIVVSLATQKISPPRILVDYYGEKLDPNLKLNFGLLPIRDAFRKITKEEKEIT
ncbi:MAG: sodium solute transporter superfamily protein [Chloroflexi bacterium]|nr:MAG: sodium solute transporter superfamily protein [Chloroflexota bacterium]